MIKTDTHKARQKLSWKFNLVVGHRASPLVDVSNIAKPKENSRDGRHKILSREFTADYGHYLITLGNDLSRKTEAFKTGHAIWYFHTHPINQISMEINLAMPHEQLKVDMEVLQQQMIEAKKNERANALKEVKRLCKEFGFTAGMLKGSLAEGGDMRG